MPSSIKWMNIFYWSIFLDAKKNWNNIYILQMFFLAYKLNNNEEMFYGCRMALWPSVV